MILSALLKTSLYILLHAYWVVKHQYCIWMHIALSILGNCWTCSFFSAILKCLLITGKGKLWRTCWDASPYCRSCGSKLLFWLSGMEVKQVLLVLSLTIDISFLMSYRFFLFLFSQFWELADMRPISFRIFSLQCRWTTGKGCAIVRFHCWETSTGFLRGVQAFSCWCPNPVHISIVCIFTSLTIKHLWHLFEFF